MQRLFPSRTVRRTPSRSPPAPAADSRWATRTWLAIAACLVLGGAVGSGLAARFVAQADAGRAAQAFSATSTEIASTIDLSIQHEQDLTISAQAFLAEHPQATQAEFVRWAAKVDALGRFPALLSLSHSVIVPASNLSAYAARAVLDPAGPLAADGSFQVTPPGTRSQYCFLQATLNRVPESAQPAGFDFCGDDGSPEAMASRDTGRNTYFPFSTPAGTMLGASTPIYAGINPPSTVVSRRAAFEGWVSVSTLPSITLEGALKGHPDTAVTFHYHQFTTDVTFTSGAIPNGADSRTIDLHNGWTVQTFTPPLDPGLFKDVTALALLICGLGAALLSGILVFVLGTGRSRARRTILRQTKELNASHQRLGALLNQTVGAAEQERTRLAMELHDGPVQRLTALAFNVDRLIRRMEDPIGTDIGNRTRVALSAEIRDLRAVMSALRPPALDQSGLEEALRDYAAGFEHDCAVPCAVTFDADPASIPPAVQTVLYRIMQEALTNVRKHAGATRVEMALTVDERGLVFTIADDGVGFAASDRDKYPQGDRFGLAAMRHRAGMIGGTTQIDARPGSGTTVSVRVPVARDTELAVLASSRGLHATA